MRLIDGDALKEAFYQKMKELLKSTDTPQISNEALSLLCGASLITEAPTIEPDIECINKLFKTCARTYTLSAYLKEGLAKVPSEQPDIIYCKDCKFYSPMNQEAKIGTKIGICNLTMQQNFGDIWFCAGAERRTDE